MPDRVGGRGGKRCVERKRGARDASCFVVPVMKIDAALFGMRHRTGLFARESERGAEYPELADDGQYERE